MTQLAEEQVEERCRWCGRRFAPNSGPGRPRRYCRPSHRQRAYEARSLAKAHALRPDQVLMSADRFEIIRDLLYSIEAALDDVDADIADGDTRQALWHLYRACADARTLSLEPLAISCG